MLRVRGLIIGLVGGSREGRAVLAATCDESNEGVRVLCVLHSIVASRAICLFAALRGVFRAREIMYSGMCFWVKNN